MFKFSVWLIRLLEALKISWKNICGIRTANNPTNWHFRSFCFFWRLQSTTCLAWSHQVATDVHLKYVWSCMESKRWRNKQPTTAASKVQVNLLSFLSGPEYAFPCYNNWGQSCWNIPCASLMHFVGKETQKHFLIVTMEERVFKCHPIKIISVKIKMGEIMGKREETWNLVLYQFRSNLVMVLGKQGQKKKKKKVPVSTRKENNSTKG